MMSLNTPKESDNHSDPAKNQQDEDDDRTSNKAKRIAEKKRLREAEWRFRSHAASGPAPDVSTGMGMEMELATQQPSVSAEEVLRLGKSIENLNKALEAEQEKRTALEEQLVKCQQIQDQALNALDDKFQHLIEMNQELEEKSKQLGECETVLKSQEAEVDHGKKEMQQLQEELKATREKSASVVEQLKESESKLSTAQALLTEYEMNLAQKTETIEEVNMKCKAIESSAKVEIAGSIEIKEELKAETSQCLELEVQQEHLVAERKQLRADIQRLLHSNTEMQQAALSYESDADSRESLIQELRIQILELNDLNAWNLKDVAKDKALLQQKLDESKSQHKKDLLRLSAQEEASKSAEHQLGRKKNELNALRMELEKTTQDHQQEILHWITKVNERDEAVINPPAEQGGHNVEKLVEVVLIVAEISAGNFIRLVQTHKALVSALRWRNPNVRVGLIAIDHHRSKNTAHVRYPELVSRESGDMLDAWLQMPYTWTGLVHDVYDFGRNLLDRVKIRHKTSATTTRIIRLVDPTRNNPEGQLHRDCQKHKTNKDSFCLLFTNSLPESWIHKKADWDAVTGGKTFIMPTDWRYTEECKIFPIEELVGRPLKSEESSSGMTGQLSEAPITVIFPEKCN